MKLIKNPIFYKNVFSLVIPIALQNSLFILLNMMDTAMLGRVRVGADAAISAAGIGNQPFFLFSLFIFGTASGAGVLISQYWGKRDKDKINKIAGISISFCFLLGVIFTALLYIFTEDVMGLYSKDKEVVSLASNYLRIVLISYIPANISTLFCGIMRAVEKVKIPLISGIISVFMNIFFNWCFIFGKLGCPELGVAGAALGTVLARFFEIVFVLVYVFGVDKTLRLRPSRMLRFEKSLVKDFFSIAFPVVCNETLWSLGITVHAAIIGNISTNAYAAYSVCTVVEKVATLFAIGYANAGAIIIGKAVGAGEKKSAYEMAKTLLVMATATGILMAIAVYFSRSLVISAFNVEMQTRNDAMMILAVMSVMLFAKSFNTLNIVGVLRGGGDTKICLLLDLLPMWFISIPLGFVSAFVFNFPSYIVYAVLISDELIKIGAGILRFVSKKWIKDIVRN